MLRQFGLRDDSAVVASKYHAGIMQLRPRRAVPCVTSKERRIQHKLVSVPQKYYFCTSVSGVKQYGVV